MQDITSREYILKKVRQALINKTNQRFQSVDQDKSVYNPEELSLEEEFAKSFSKIGGQFVFCENESVFLESIASFAKEYSWSEFYCREKSVIDLLNRKNLPVKTDFGEYPEGMAGVTTCEALVSRLGSILISSRQGSGRKLFVAPTVHIIIARTSQLVREIREGLQLIKNKYGDQFPSMIASLAGPSRTADIEKTLVTPAHGPRDIYVFLIDD